MTLLYSLLCPRLCGEDFLLLLFVIFVNFIYALDFLHAVGQLPGFLSRAASCHGEVSEQCKPVVKAPCFCLNDAEKS